MREESYRIYIKDINKEKNNNLLIERNLKLVVKLAIIYEKYYPYIDDLIQEGNIGLLEAVRKYKKGEAKFTTYAYYWIRVRIIRFILKEYKIKNLGEKRREVSIEEIGDKIEIRTETEEIKEEITKALDLLNIHEKEIIEGRDGICSEVIKLKELSMKYRLSIAMIKYIENKALKKLRIKLKYFKNYLGGD